MIDEIDLAVKHVEKKLKKKVLAVLQVNHNRHRFVYFTDGSAIYLMFKRESLLSWKKLFPDLKDIETIVLYVDSINVPLYYSMLDNYLKPEIKEKFIVICYQDETVLKIDPEEWLRRAELYSLFRKINNLEFQKKPDYSGNNDYQEETTVSCFFTKDEIVK